MVNYPVSQITQVAGKSTGILKVFGWVFLSLFMIILIINVIYISLDTKSIEPIITEIGGKLFLSSRQLSITSNMIIDNNGVYQRTDDFWSGIGTMLNLLGLLFLSVYVIYQWIKIGMWLVARSPLSTTSDVFKNLMISVMIFFVLQSLFSLSVAGVNKEIDSFSGTEHSAMSYIIQPVTSFVDLWNAMKFIVYPVHDSGIVEYDETIIVDKMLNST